MHLCHKDFQDKMVNSCCIVGCHNRDDRTKPWLSFYRIPAASVDPDRRNRWISAISREDWMPTEFTRLCSEHFISGQKSEDPLSPDYIPSLFPYTPPMKRKRPRKNEICLRRTEGKKKRQSEPDRQMAAQALLHMSVPGSQTSPSLVEDIKPALLQDIKQEDEMGEVNVGEVKIKEEHVHELPVKLECIHCDRNIEEINILRNECEKLRTENFELNKLGLECESLRKECQALRTENLELKEKLNAANLTDFDGYQGKDDKVTFMTGIQSFAVLMTIFNFLGSKIKKTTNSSLSQSQQFLLTLLCLRLNLSAQFLGYLFGVHQSTASRIFLHVIDVMHNSLVPTVMFWPDKELIRTTLPTCFLTTFPNCVSIIDCFVVFCEKPSNLKAKTYSSYKTRITVKYLVSITPQGTISFISKGWGAQVCDKHVVENSGYLEHLLPGDTVLADRDLNVETSIALHGATLYIPAFTKGETQLGAREVENIDAVRIHVEKVIGLMRQKYTFLDSTVPVAVLTRTSDGLSFLDKIVEVCAALCNTCTSVVPQG